MVKIDEKQIDGQMEFSGNSIIESANPLKEKKSIVVEEDGTSFSYVDEMTDFPIDSDKKDRVVLELLKPGKFDIRNFHKSFGDNTEAVLYHLLSLQSNKNPLKKGGESIAYRCDALILQNRQTYTESENSFMDVLLGMVSSAPEDEAYFITAKDFARILGFEDEDYAYKFMTDNHATIRNKPFVFNASLNKKNPNKKTPIDVSWYDLLTRVKKEDVEPGEFVGIAFNPSKFFRMLIISSTISHGAHYPINLAHLIKGNYAKILFYYIYSQRTYREYPGARPGYFKKTFEEVKEILGTTSSYKWSDVNRRAFKVVKEAINNYPDTDCAFDYEKKGNDIYFMISSKPKRVSNKSQEQIEDKSNDGYSNQNDTDKITVIAILNAHGIIDKDADNVYKHYKENKRDIVFLTQALTSIATSEGIKSKAAVLCSIMDNGIGYKQDKENKKRNNKFSNFNQREYDYDELERQLLNSDPQ